MLIELHSDTDEQRILVSVKAASLSLSLGEVEVYSYDSEGRLYSGWFEDQTFIRTLDNRVVKKWRDPAHTNAWKSIEELAAVEKADLLNRVRARADAVRRELRRQDAGFVRAPAAQVRSMGRALEWLGKIVAWDYGRLEKERERFFSAYKPVTILPPDQYLAVVLQATEGCHWNRCTFCHFYRDRRFHIKSEEEFGRHISAVKDLFGDALRLRRSIFLGDANALVIPQERLLGIFQRVNREFTIATGELKPGSDRGHCFRGMYSFIDAFTGDKKSEADFRDLKAANLQRVYVGIETGCDELLEFLNKPLTSERALDAITTMKQAGLSVGVIILIGVGGDRYSRPHVEQTVKLLNELHLGQGDLIYFSPLVELTASEYAERSADAGVCPLTDQERREQLRAIRSGLRFAGDKMPKISLYDIREFLY
jgi:radical SAM superfamily enzyme YgiQ (UPF0313 family)